jgi:hypothetical protein
VQAKPEKKPSAVSRTKELLIENPRRPLKDISDTLRAEGFTFADSTPATVRVDFLHSLKMLQAAGYARDLEI